jgi:hypothetical protein
MPHKSKHSPKEKRSLAETPRPEFEAELRPLLVVLRVAGFFLLAIAVIGWMAPWERLWGAHCLAFLPPLVSVILALCSALLLSPLGSTVVQWLGRHLGWLGRRSLLFWMIGGLTVFLTLRVSVPILGDGQLWIQQLVTVAEFEVWGKDLPDGRVTRRKEALEIGLHEVAFRAVDYVRQSVRPQPLQSKDSIAIAAQKHVFKMEAWGVYAVLSAIAGSLFLALIIGFARKCLSPPGRSLFITLMLSGGGMLLFFGYVENYSWATLAIVACLLTGIVEAEHPRYFPWKTAVVFALAVGLHLASIILLPAVAFLYLAFFMRRLESRFPGLSPARYARWFMVTLATLAVGGYLALRLWHGKSSILPLLPQWSRDGYALLGGSHLEDYLNLLVLVAPLSLAIVFCLRRAGHDRLVIRRTFLTIAAAGGLIFALIFDPNLGMPRDWDLLALSLWPLIILAAWTLANTMLMDYRNPLLAAILAMILIGTIPFILVNAGEDASLRRYGTLLRLDPRRSGYGWENLAKYYEEIEENSKAIQAWQSAVVVDPNPRYKVNLGNSLRLAGRLNEAEPYYIAAAQANPKFVKALYKLARDNYQRGNVAKSIELVRLMTDLLPNEVEYKQLLENLEKSSGQSLPDNAEDN